MGEIRIRAVTEEDAAALLEIYAYYVRETIVTYEYEVPTEAEFRERIRKTKESYPYFAAVEEGRILGYAYGAAFHPRAAYQWAAEVSIYLRQESRGRGVGRLLYTALEQALRRQNVWNCNACIADPNPQSVVFHEKMGYRLAGRFTDCAYKQGRWLGMIWMEKQLGVHPNPPKPFLPYPIAEKEKR